MLHEQNMKLIEPGLRLWLRKGRIGTFGFRSARVTSSRASGFLQGSLLESLYVDPRIIWEQRIAALRVITHVQARIEGVEAINAMVGGLVVA
ncbi:hypothetical protein Tco_0218425 [Tanacetum coccineum]